MKKVLSFAVVLFMAIGTTLVLSSFEATVSSTSVTATFEGVSEDGEFTFIDGNDTTILFQELSDAVEVDLYDEAMVGKKMKVTYQTETRGGGNEEEEETEQVEILVITALEVLD